MEEIIIIGIGFVPASEQGSHMLTRNEMTEELQEVYPFLLSMI